jgi:hypothetical protein
MKTRRIIVYWKLKMVSISVSPVDVECDYIRGRNTPYENSRDITYKNGTTDPGCHTAITNN